MKKNIRILIADDHKIVVEGLRSLLEEEYDLVGMAENGRELLKLVKKLGPDVIVVDISMPLLNGIDAVAQLRESGCEAKVIFLTMHNDPAYAARAFDAGASGFVLKHSAPSELLTAIEKALEGGQFISPMITESLMEHYKTGGHGQGDPMKKLTPRQREVLQLLAEGKSAKEIAKLLSISARTAEFHKYHIMEEMGLSNSAEIIHFAIKQGIISI
jgi:DNA-binding NarL/FixJ family response regulator